MNIIDNKDTLFTATKTHHNLKEIAMLISICLYVFSYHFILKLFKYLKDMNIIFKSNIILIAQEELNSSLIHTANDDHKHL